jgi:hypothetical protein
VSGLPLDPSLPANPCGLVAKSIFNDTFTLYKGIVNDHNLKNANKVNWTEKGIAWETDIMLNFHRLEEEGKQWKDY